MSDKRFWLVNVTCWGEVVVYDTEKRAEGWRGHKAAWEGCVARKREISRDEAFAWLEKQPYTRAFIDGEGSNVMPEAPPTRSETKTYTVSGMVHAELTGASLEVLLDAWASRHGGHPEGFVTSDGEGGWVIGRCEDCMAVITDADSYYQWGGKDPVETCMDCGGADESHVPTHPQRGTL